MKTNTLTFHIDDEEDSASPPPHPQTAPTFSKVAAVAADTCRTPQPDHTPRVVATNLAPNESIAVYANLDNHLDEVVGVGDSQAVIDVAETATKIIPSIADVTTLSGDLTASDCIEATQSASSPCEAPETCVVAQDEAIGLHRQYVDDQHSRSLDVERSVLLRRVETEHSRFTEELIAGLQPSTPAWMKWLGSQELLGVIVAAIALLVLFLGAQVLSILASTVALPAFLRWGVYVTMAILATAFTLGMARLLRSFLRLRSTPNLQLDHFRELTSRQEVRNASVRKAFEHVRDRL